MFGARALGDALHVEAVQSAARSQWTMGTRKPTFGPVFSRVSVCTVFERSGCSMVARSVPARRAIDARRVEREVLADAAVVDRDPGVLADEVLLVLGHRDVLQDRLQDALARDRGLLLGGRAEGVPQVAGCPSAPRRRGARPRRSRRLRGRFR